MKHRMKEENEKSKNSNRLILFLSKNLIVELHVLSIWIFLHSLQTKNKRWEIPAVFILTLKYTTYKTRIRVDRE
jgi:hypothetical protein